MSERYYVAGLEDDFKVLQAAFHDARGNKKLRTVLSRWLFRTKQALEQALTLNV